MSFSRKFFPSRTMYRSISLLIRLLAMIHSGVDDDCMIQIPGSRAPARLRVLPAGSMLTFSDHGRFQER